MAPKSYATSTYLVRNPYTYCFRLRVPVDLQNMVGRKELRYSLKTGNLTQAKVKARIYAGHVQMLFSYLRGDKARLESLTDDKIQEMVQKFLKKQRALWSGPMPPPEYRSSETGATPYDRASYESFIGELDARINDDTVDIGTGNYTRIVETANKLLLENGVQEIDKSNESYWKFCTELLKAHREGLHYAKDQTTGKRPAQSNQQAILTVNTADTKTGKLISELFPLWASEQKIAWNEKTQSEVKAAIDLFIEIMGDVPVVSVTRQNVSAYKQTLMKLPPNMRKKKEYRDKSINEILQMKPQKILSGTRINKLLQRVSGLFKYAIKNGYYVGDNPATEMQLPKNKNAKDLRAAYTNQELELLFRSQESLDDKFSRSYMFWTPTIALFHGMRREEIASLFLDDIKKSEDGVWIFDIRDKTLKTKASNRIIPIHPFLLKDLKLLEHVDALKKAGEVQLFPELKKGRDGYGINVGRWFNEKYKTSCGIKTDDERLRDFHSFRGTFITHLRHKKADIGMLKAVVGHSQGDDVTDDYTDPYDAEVLLKEIIKKVNFHKKIDLSHLKNSKYVVK
jgi:integrase